MSIEAKATSVSLKQDQQLGADVIKWSDLPADLVQTISKKLHDMYDFVYFRSVCKNWYASTSMSDLPPLIPWLLHNDPFDEHVSVYSIFTGKAHTIHCPRNRLRGMWGPSHGYLYTFQHDPKGCSLLNPLTNDEVTLRFRTKNYLYHPFMVCRSLNLTEDDDYIAFLDRFSKRIEYYQPHKNKSKTNNICARGRDLFPQEARGVQACLKGRHFMHQKDTCDTRVFDIAGGFSFMIPPPPELDSRWDKVFFVESEGGKILRTVKHWKKNNRDLIASAAARNDYVFYIYQLDVEDETRHQYKWAKIHTIGDHVLFLDYRSNVSGICVAATASTGLKGNCIYYIEHYDDASGWDFGIYCYDIEHGRSRRIPCPLKDPWTWFLPSLVSLAPSS